MTVERRKHQRIKNTAVVNFSVPEKIANGHGVLRDLCAAGMQISINTELQIGEVIEFLEAESLPCTSGFVRWCHQRDGFYLIGIEFSQPLKTNVSSAPFYTSEQR